MIDFRLLTREIPETPTYSFAEIDRSLTDLEIAASVAGNESFKGIFAAIANIFSRVFHNFATIAARFLKTMKRSELQFYHDSYPLNWKKLTKIQYTELSRINIPIPRGMVSTYPIMTKELIEMVNSLNMGDRAEIALKSIKSIHDDLLSESPNLSTKLAGAYEVFNDKIDQQIDKKLHKLSNPKYTVLEVPFAAQFKSMREFLQTDSDLLELSRVYDEVQKVMGYLTKIQDYMDNLIKEETYLEYVTKQDLKTLASVVRLYASVFDVYGRVIHHYNRLEHNYVETIKALCKAKNI